MSENELVDYAARHSLAGVHIVNADHDQGEFVSGLK